jgi:nucleotide-binding universal stress UspA family protein
MFARVLFPTDFSAYANAVFDCLPGLKAAGLKQVILLSVIRTGDVPMADTPVNEESFARVKWSAEENLHIAQHALEGQGVSARTRVEYGDPAREIVRIAQDECIDLIVMGAQGQSLFQDLLLGNTAFDVLRLSPIPVLIEKCDVVREMGHTQCQRVCQTTCTRVLHPTDFSACANAAFNLVKRLKPAGMEEAILLHVQDERAMQQRPADQIAEFDRQDFERLEQMKRTLALSNIPAKTMVRHGIPFRETLKVADEEKATVIVVGLYGRNAFEEMVGGGTFEKIVRQSRRPVLVVRETK